MNEWTLFKCRGDLFFLDKDECETHYCGVGECVNTDGSFECTCFDGYEVNDQRVCVGKSEIKTFLELSSSTDTYLRVHRMKSGSIAATLRVGIVARSIRWRLAGFTNSIKALQSNTDTFLRWTLIRGSQFIGLGNCSRRENFFSPLSCARFFLLANSSCKNFVKSNTGLGG